jgi:hypothetical protein
MYYQFITIQPNRASLDVVLNDNSEYSRGVRRETALAMAAPILRNELEAFVSAAANGDWRVSQITTEAAQ